MVPPSLTLWLSCGGAAREHTLAFSHTLEDQIGGQLRAGFHLIDMFEDAHPANPLSAYLPSPWPPGPSSPERDPGGARDCKRPQMGGLAIFNRAIGAKARACDLARLTVDVRSAAGSQCPIMAQR